MAAVLTRVTSNLFMSEVSFESYKKKLWKCSIKNNGIKYKEIVVKVAHRYKIIFYWGQLDFNFSESLGVR